MDGVTISGQGPAVILLHSSLSSAKQWQNLTKTLSAQFTCINIDLLGYGKAPSVTDIKGYSFATEITRIEQILVDANITGPYHLIGHSCGGAIALKMALEMAQQNMANLLSVTLFEPVAFHLLEQQNNHAVKLFANKLRRESNLDAARDFVNYWNGEGYFQQLPQVVQTQMAMGMDKVNLDFNGIFAEQYSLADLRALSCPVLLMLGKYTSAESQQLSKAIGDAISHCQLVRIDSGHMAPLSHPQLVEPVIVDFLIKQCE